MKKPVIFALPAALVLLAVGYFVVMPMMKGKPAQALDEEPATTAQAKKKSKHAPEPGLMYPIPERVLNLSSSAGMPHYARIELAIEFERPANAPPPPKAKKEGAAKDGAAAPLDPALEPVAARKAQIDDALIRIVGTKTMESMTTAEGRDALKQEFLAAIEEMVTKPLPVQVYIVRLIVQ